MSCRHDLALGTCSRCYPDTGTRDPGPEDEYEPNLEGPGTVTLEEHDHLVTHTGDAQPASEGSSYQGRLLVDGTPFELFRVANGEALHFVAVDRRSRDFVEERGRIREWPTEAEAREWCWENRDMEVVRRVRRASEDDGQGLA